MDLSNVKELSEKFASLYINSLPKLQEFEQERRMLCKNMSILLECPKLYQFRFKVKSYFLSEIKEIFGIKSWRKGTKVDEKELLAILKSNNIVGFQTEDSHLIDNIEEIITGSYKGVSYRIWDMVHELIIEFNSNKTIKNTTTISSKGIRDPLRRIDVIIIIIFYLIFFMLFAGVKLNFWLCLFLVIGGFMFIKRLLKFYLDGKNILEDPQFSKRYDVYSTDPVEARYLLTTSFMERFKTLEKDLDTHRIQCVFNNNKIYFAIYSYTNRFELVNIIEKIDSPKQFRRFFNDLTTIIGMIDSFKFDEKTGL